VKTSTRRVATIVGGTAGALALFGFGYLARSWCNYGKVSTAGTPDPLLDRFMPTYEVREYHEIRVAAPVDIAYAATRAMDINRSPVVRGIFRARQLALGADDDAAPPRPLLEETRALGWGILAEEPGREIVMGAVTQPWLANVRFEGLPPDEFAEFSRPAYVKIAFTLAADPIDSNTSLVRSETRVATTNAYARQRFRRYWTLVSPGVRLIRLKSMRLVRADAERRAQAVRAHNDAEEAQP
jgi:hypothetical protein